MSGTSEKETTESKKKLCILEAFHFRWTPLSHIVSF